MSETDDTDVLLLIPPNFFLVQSSGSEDSLLESSRTVVHKPTSCTAQVLGKLVHQVHTLESRLESLEITGDLSSLGTLLSRKNGDTTDSFDNCSVDRKCFTFPRRQRRKTKRDRKRELSVTSLDSIRSRHHIPLLKLPDTSLHIKYIRNINDTQSMEGDISSIVSTPSKNNDKLLLHEIDEFLTKVESYESPDSKYNEQQSTLSPENVIKATGDYITQKLGSQNDRDEIKLPSGRMVSSNVLDKYIYLVKNHSASQTDKSVPSSSKKYNDSTIHSDATSKYEIPKQEIKSPSIRRLNFSDKDIQPTSTPKKPQQSYLDTFKPSSNKIYDRASKVLEQYKSQNQSQSYRTKEEFKMPQMRPYNVENKESIKMTAMQNRLMNSIDTDLLSLSELWGEKGDGDRVDNIKLEEERLKREHCEAMIQQLQKKILEQQEKLAVALKVDRAKDAVIVKLREAWLRLTSSLDKAEERHRSALEKMVREVDNFRTVANDAQKKTNHFEAELYKALDLAHDYQEKCKQLTAEKKEMQDNMDKTLANKCEVISNKDRELEVVRDNYETVMRMNKQSMDCVKNLEDALQKERSEHEQTKLKVSELSRKIQSNNDEATLTLQERDLLKGKVNEERARCNMLERQLSEEQNQARELLKKCEALEDEAKTLRKHAEVQKNELKSHYQKQLEEAVLCKLHEFQQQLDTAEREMENDVRSKENVIVDTYNKQIFRIEEQHKLEVNVLEEKQKEEIKLCRLQLAQAHEKIGLLEDEVEWFRRRRRQMATQLHGVMQAQWRQALRILTRAAPDPVSGPIGQDYAPPKIPPLTMPDGGLTWPDGGLTRPDGGLTRPDGGLTRPDGGPTRPDAMFNFEGLSDHELQQYVKLLLTKPVELEGGGECAGSRDLGEEPTSDRPDRDRTDCDRPDRDRTDRDRRHPAARRALNSTKPPWKA